MQHDRDRRQRHLRAGQRDDHRVRGERADHHDLAVREVDELDDPVDHRVAERDDRVDAAERQAVHDLLQEDVHSGASDRGSATVHEPRPDCGGAAEMGNTGARKRNGAPKGAAFVRRCRLLLRRCGRGRGRRSPGRRPGAVAGAAGAERGHRLDEVVVRRGLAALHDGDRLDLAALQREDRDLGVLAVALLVELDLAGGAVVADLLAARAGTWPDRPSRPSASRRS